MSYTTEESVYFPANPGLATVGYTLTGQPRTTSGVSESATVPGLYAAAVVAPDGYSGPITWDTGTTPTRYAYDFIGPPASVTSTATAAVATGYPALAPLAQAYSSDEDIALRAPVDFVALAPPSQVKAQAADGVFASGSPWVLTSGSVSFLNQGVHARQCCWLTAPRTTFGQGQLLAIDSVGTGGTSLTLRRLGCAPGLGQPPAPAAGLSGVSFQVLTFDPQIDIASYDANKTFGIDPSLPDHAPGLIYDLRVLSQYTTLLVLGRAYAARLHERREDYVEKLAHINRELAELRGRTVVQWGPLGQGNFPSGPFGARVRR